MSKMKDFLVIMNDVSQIAGDIFKCHIETFLSLQKETWTKLLTWLLLVLGAMLVILAGLVFILWGMHFQLALATGPVAAAFIMGGGLILAGVIVFLLARGYIKD